MSVYKIERGSRVKVVKGRKVPIGTEGTVFWVGENKFSNPNFPSYNAGFKTDSGGKAFTSLSNLVKILSPDEIAAQAKFEADAAAEAAAKAKKDAEEQAVADQAGIDFTNEAYIGDEQEAYGGANVSIASFKPDASDEAIKLAIYRKYPPTSSWGQLRWCRGASVREIDHKANTVTYAVLYGMCD